MIRITRAKDGIMTQVSNHPISKAVADRIFDVFAKTLIGLKAKSDVDDFVDDLFSPTEKIMFSKRIAIAFLLMKGYSYRDINKLLRVSTSTIGAIGLSLKHGKGGYDRIINKIAKEEKLEDFFKAMVEKILSAPASSPTGGSVWRYLRDEVKRSRDDKNRTGF